MSSHDRFYQLEMRNRPVLHGDISSLVKIDGLVVGGGGALAVLLLPSCSPMDLMRSKAPIYRLNEDEWSDFIRRSDDPEILIGNSKAFQRKARYEISGLVQQKIWVADGFICMYCRRSMGAVQLTIDHFIPLEIGGANNQSNYLSACRRCNKDKGSEDPREFCKRLKSGYDYDHYVKYLAERKV